MQNIYIQELSITIFAKMSTPPFNILKNSQTSLLKADKTFGRESHLYPSGALALECALVLIRVSMVWKRSASVMWPTLRSSTSSSFTSCMANATAM